MTLEVRLMTLEVRLMTIEDRLMTIEDRRMTMYTLGLPTVLTNHFIDLMCVIWLDAIGHQFNPQGGSLNTVFCLDHFLLCEYAEH